MKKEIKGAILPFQKYHGRPKGTIGSSVLRSDWLIDKWEEVEEFQEGKRYSFIIFQKVYWLKYLEDYDGVKILDIADPDWLTGELNIKQLETHVDAFTCSSKGIADFLKGIVKKPVYHVPDRINLDIIDRQKKHNSIAKRVGWFGYYHNAKIVLPTVLLSLAKLGLDLVVISNNDFKPSATYGVKIENRVFDWEVFKDDLLTCDIVLNPVPLTIGKFKYKSDNKSAISWACGVPIANTKSDLERLMSASEREKEAKEKYELIKKEYDIEISIKDFESIIKKICKTKTPQ